MKVIAINGSPRKNFNTGTLLKKHLKELNLNVQTQNLSTYMNLIIRDVIAFFCVKLGAVKVMVNVPENDELKRL